MGMFGLGTSESESHSENYSNSSTSGELSPLTQGKRNRVVMGNETIVKNRNNVKLNNSAKYNLGKNASLTINNGASEDQVSGWLDKIGDFLKTNLGGSGDSAGGSAGSSGGTTIAYSTPPSIANEQTSANATTTSLRWVMAGVVLVGIAALALLSKKKKS